ncbi:MAG: cysteine hydrolase [Lachnospiraceae bacterium]|nr:cysteine hydrolase [Lachnospiraceae bacterium]
MRKLLIVVDMQNDFVTGALRNEDAIAIVPTVAEKIRAAKEAGTEVIFTRDTHFEDYMETEEGRNLPVLHCLKGTEGWEIIDELKAWTEDAKIIDKITFGARELGDYLAEENEKEKIDEVELIGICTDICVISNALLTKAFLPNIPIGVDAACCAGITPQTHKNALEAMKMCQIRVTNEPEQAEEN